MKSIIKRSALVVLLAANAVEAGSFSSYFPSDLFSTSLVMLEAAIPSPQSLVELQESRKQDEQKDLVLVENSEQAAVDTSAESEEARLKLNKLKNKNKQTTLTIVQDFPKKKVDQSSVISINLVQDHSQMNETKPMNPNAPLASPFKDDDKNSTTLIIGQDLVQQKKDNNMAGNVEMVQGQEQNTHLHFKKSRKDSSQKGTTLTIVQDFPKKKLGDQANNNVHVL